MSSAKLFDLFVSIEGPAGQTPWIRTSVAAVIPASPSILAIIGRDVLHFFTLLYGPEGTFALAC